MAYRNRYDWEPLRKLILTFLKRFTFTSSPSKESFYFTIMRGGLAMEENFKTKREPIFESMPSGILNIILENISEGVLVTDEKKTITFVNSSFEYITGYHREEIIGKTPSMLKSGIHDQKFYQLLWNTVHQHGIWQGEIWNKKKSGEIYPEWLKIIAIKDKQGRVANYVGIFSDISEKKIFENVLEEKILTDTLTNVNNRYSYLIKMNSLLESSPILGHQKVQHAVFFLDLNRFKQINDTLGHTIGDSLLVEVAKRLKKLIDEKDIIARHGGDEFIITLANIHHPREAAQFAQLIIREMEEPFIINGQEIYITTSIGISLYPMDGHTTDELIYCADKAMYYAKQKGTNSFSFYFDELNVDTSHLLILDNEMRKAIGQKQFAIVYQPKISLTTNKVIGLEALVRWENEKLGKVSPDEFIPYAEESGLIIPLSEAIFELVCNDLSRLRQSGYPDLHISINVSSLHFQQYNFLHSIQKILEKNNISAKNLEIEVTERTVMNSDADTIRKLVRLKQLGFKIAIDDFGTGYSSLSYLVRFPIDYLKIDKSFIQHITTFDDKQAVVDAIIQMAHRLNMEVIAEGVESLQQVNLLKKMGCDFVQGYYFCKPKPVHDIIDFLRIWENEHQGWL